MERIIFRSKIIHGEERNYRTIQAYGVSLGDDGKEITQEIDEKSFAKKTSQKLINKGKWFFVSNIGSYHPADYKEPLLIPRSKWKKLTVEGSIDGFNEYTGNWEIWAGYEDDNEIKTYHLHYRGGVVKNMIRDLLLNDMDGKIRSKF